AASQTINLDLLAWGGFCHSLAFLRSPASQKPSVSMLSSRLSSFSRTDHAYPISLDQSGDYSGILPPGEVFSDYAGATPEQMGNQPLKGLIAITCHLIRTPIERCRQRLEI
ncbi:hypothetical protein, partial [Deinococcus frigens]|uniref:hypothetical protein n=1 Tax=Deinococcus frigens TaxID=249403 RepID=UPI001B805AC7